MKVAVLEGGYDLSNLLSLSIYNTNLVTFIYMISEYIHWVKKKNVSTILIQTGWIT